MLQQQVCAEPYTAQNLTGWLCGCKMRDPPPDALPRCHNAAVHSCTTHPATRPPIHLYLSLSVELVTRWVQRLSRAAECCPPARHTDAAMAVFLPALSPEKQMFRPWKVPTRKES